MLRLVADENFNRDIVRGLLRRLPGIDVVRVQEVGLGGEDDPMVLAWAASEGRLVLTHDKATIGAHGPEQAAEAPWARRGDRGSCG